MKFFKLVIGLAIGSIIGSATTLQAQHNCASAKQKSSLVALNKANATPVQMELMEKFDITFHHLNLSIERDTKLIQGHVRTIAKLITLYADTFGFQLHSNFLIDSIVDVRTLTKISFTRVQDFCYVPLLGNSAINEVVDIKIFYKGTAPTSGSAAIGDGFSNRASPTYGNQISWSLSQPYSAYEWWPCKQSLQDKIDSVFTSIKTDTSNKVGACGLLNEIENNGQGKHTFHWKSFLPIDYYLIMVSVGKYTEYISYAKPKGINDSILVQHYIYNNPLAYSQNLTSINSTVPLIEKFSELFGVYPFYQEKYGHVMAPFSGGMEHQTMTTLGIFNFGIVAHELGHQWFGDHVTCKTWKDIWLNEGMATYLEYIAAKYLKTPAVAENELLVMHAEAKKVTGSVYCYDTTNVSRIFSSAITYNKGGSVVRVLHYLLGDSLFFDVLKNYQQRFAFKTASTADFNSLVNEISGRNYDYFFNTWIYKNGWPTYNLKWNQIDSGLYLQFTQENFEDPSNLFDLYLPIKVNFKNGLDTMIYVRQKDASSSYMVKMNQTISSINLDPENWILKNATIKFDATINSMPLNWSDATVSIYPNPCKDKLFIDNLPTGNIQYSLYDNNGRLLEAKKLNDNSTIDLSNIEVGAYFLTLSLNEKPLLGRFIVISR